MFTYRLHLEDGSDVGETAYAQMIKPGEESLLRRRTQVPRARRCAVRGGRRVAVRRAAEGRSGVAGSSAPPPRRRPLFVATAWQQRTTCRDSPHQSRPLGGHFRTEGDSPRRTPTWPMHSDPPGSGQPRAPAGSRCKAGGRHRCSRGGNTDGRSFRLRQRPFRQVGDSKQRRNPSRRS